MSECYVGEIRLLPYMRGAPSEWQICDGSLLQISDYEILYQLLGTTYGGDGQTTFGVPDLRGRVPIHQGSSPGLSAYQLGQTGGTEQVTLSTANMATHNHLLQAANTAATSANPTAAVIAVPQNGDTLYAATPGPASAVDFPATMVMPAGQSTPHENCAPTLSMQYCIATEGIYPPQQ